MLLVLDVGNTNTVLGLYAAEESGGEPRYGRLVAHWRVATVRSQTADEYGVLFRNLFAMKRMEARRVAGIIISSVVLRPHLAPADAVTLSLAAGLAVQAAVKQVTGLEPDLRWPNDVLLKDKKFCGILTEMNAEATRVRYAVVGIGLNVNHADLPGELRGRATSLRLETGRAWSRVELAAALLKSLDREYRSLDSTDPAASDALLRRFEERSSYARGKQVRVEENGGFEGVTEGLDARGFLRVRTADGLRTVLSGGVRAL